MKFPCKLRKTTKLCRNIYFLSVAQTFRLEPTSTPTRRVAIYPLFLSSNSHCQVYMAEKVILFPFHRRKSIGSLFYTSRRQDEQIYFQPHTIHKLITRDRDHELWNELLYHWSVLIHLGPQRLRRAFSKDLF